MACAELRSATNIGSPPPSGIKEFYASGLSYYYFVSLLITIIQTYIFRKCINEEKVLAKLKENQKKPRKKSGFMARLEEAQRQQQAALKRQQQQRRR